MRTRDRMMNIAMSMTIAGLCFAISTGLAETQETEPVATGSAPVTDSIDLWVRITQAVVTIIAMMLGRLFAWGCGFGEFQVPEVG